MIETIMIIVMLTSAVLPSSLPLNDSDSGDTASSKGNYTYSLDNIIDKNQSMTKDCDPTNNNSTIIVDTVHKEMARFCYDNP